MGSDDAVVGMEIPTEGNTMVAVSEKGFGKRTYASEYPVHGRGGQGVVNLKTVPKVGSVSGILQVAGNEDIILISNAGKIIRMRVEEVPIVHRAAQGVKLIELESEEKLVGLARAEREESREQGVDMLPGLELDDADEEDMEG
jgi:DNA gyrase subunit A